MFLNVSVCPQGGGSALGGVSAPGEVGLLPGGRGVPPLEGCLLGGVCSQGGACLGGFAPGGSALGEGVVETPRDGYCYGRFASYWNAFLFIFILGGRNCVGCLSVCYANTVRLPREGASRGGNYGHINTAD